MAERDLTNIPNNVEEDLKHNPTPMPAHVVESRFVPQRHRTASDTLEQIQQDFRKSVADMEIRFKAILDELKRVAG